MGFFSSFIKTKASSAVQQVTEKIISLDPETATEAEIDNLDKQLTEATDEFVNLRTEYQREKREADLAKENQDNRIAAAEILEAKYNAETDEGKKSELEDALNELLTDIENNVSEVKREKEEADEAKKLMDEYELVVKDLTKQLSTVRQELTKAANAMKLAKVREKRAKDHEEKVKVLTGIKKSANNHSTALSVMQKKTDEAKARAEAFNMKAESLKPQPKNSLVSDAMAEVSGNIPKTSIKDRLAALKK